MVDPEHPMFVAVERNRLAPGLQIGASSLKIRERRLAFDKLQMHQPAGRGGGEHRRLTLRHHVARATYGVRRVGVDDVAGHQPVKQHPQRRKVLFHRRLGELPL